MGNNLQLSILALISSKFLLASLTTLPKIRFKVTSSKHSQMTLSKVGQTGTTNGTQLKKKEMKALIDSNRGSWLSKISFQPNNPMLLHWTKSPRLLLFPVLEFNPKLILFLEERLVQQSNKQIDHKYETRASLSPNRTALLKFQTRLSFGSTAMERLKRKRTFKEESIEASIWHTTESVIKKCTKPLQAVSLNWFWV